MILPPVGYSSRTLVLNNARMKLLFTSCGALSSPFGISYARVFLSLSRWMSLQLPLFSSCVSSDARTFQELCKVPHFTICTVLDLYHRVCFSSPHIAPNTCISSTNISSVLCISPASCYLRMWRLAPLHGLTGNCTEVHWPSVPRLQSAHVQFNGIKPILPPTAQQSMHAMRYGSIVS